MTLEVGRKYKIYYNENNPNNRLIHVRAIVDGMIVCRSWSHYKQRWIYSVEDPIYIRMLEDEGKIFYKGSSDDQPSYSPKSQEDDGEMD